MQLDRAAKSKVPELARSFHAVTITELQKQRMNHGKRPQFYFWRDSSGHEIDLLEDQGVDLTSMEIKAGRTITSDFFKRLRFWARLTGRQGGRVIYGGEHGPKRSEGMEVPGWQDLLKDGSNFSN